MRGYKTVKVWGFKCFTAGFSMRSANFPGKSACAWLWTVTKPSCLTWRDTTIDESPDFHSKKWDLGLQFSTESIKIELYSIKNKRRENRWMPIRPGRAGRLKNSWGLWRWGSGSSRSAESSGWQAKYAALGRRKSGAANDEVKRNLSFTIYFTELQYSGFESVPKKCLR